MYQNIKLDRGAMLFKDLNKHVSLLPAVEIRAKVFVHLNPNLEI